MRTIRGRPMVAAIRPQGKPRKSGRCRRATHRPGRDARRDRGPGGARGDRRRGAARREARRRPLRVHRPWKGGERIFKVVSFFLLRAGRGRIGEIEEGCGSRSPRRAGCRSTRRRGCSPTGRARDGGEGVRENLRRVNELLNVGDYLDAASAKVDPAVWCYFEGGAGDEVTLRDERRRVRPLAAAAADARGRRRASASRRPCSARPCRCRSASRRSRLQRLLDPEAERATARAAAAHGALTVRLDPHLVPPRRDAGRRRRAALAPALRPDRPRPDARPPRRGARDRLRRRRAHGRSRRSSAAASATCAWASRYPRTYRSTYGTLDRAVDPTLTWRDLDWIRAEQRSAPRPERDPDAGGRAARGRARRRRRSGSRTTAAASSTVWPRRSTRSRRSSRPSDGRCEVYVDGGIRRGSDVVKALALGAQAAFVGRARSPAGSRSTARRVSRDVLELLHDEIGSALGLLGCTSPEQVTRATSNARPYELAVSQRALDVRAELLLAARRRPAADGQEVGDDPARRQVRQVQEGHGRAACSAASASARASTSSTR